VNKSVGGSGKKKKDRRNFARNSTMVVRSAWLVQLLAISVQVPIVPTTRTTRTMIKKERIVFGFKINRKTFVVKQMW